MLVLLFVGVAERNPSPFSGRFTIGHPRRGSGGADGQQHGYCSAINSAAAVCFAALIRMAIKVAQQAENKGQVIQAQKLQLLIAITVDPRALYVCLA
ncbi:hypothetical protein ACN1C3_31165 [Pseudomonas sp. H11T01]|uniref:hypothetical protein n=1 Tax=Pseudomonas sp. H11T01 TaxID=3402749 RepID=UPI003ACFC27D